VLLAAYVLTVTLGREQPQDVSRNVKRTFVALGLSGVVLLFWLRHSGFVSSYGWDGGRGTVFLGPIGKAYVSYLLFGGVLVGYNLESTYRSTSSDARHRLKLPFSAILFALAYSTFVLSTGILYSAIGVGKLVASGIPIAFANILVGYGIVRGAITDVAAPVSRGVVYSSFTALAAGLYVVAIGLVGQVANFTRWSPDEVVTLSFGFLAVIVAILLLFSNRFQRRVRRFIDRNFYVNRYDYRTQWSNLTRALETALERDQVMSRAESVLKSVFLADEVTIALRGQDSRAIRPSRGKGSDSDDAILEVGSPLFVRLERERQALLLDHRPDDLDYIPIYAENRHWLAVTASDIVAPLLGSDGLIGAVGLQRSHKDDKFTFEDVELLDSVAGHLSASLRLLQLAEELAESREIQVMSQWSDMLLHDFKNYLTPIRMVAQNLERFKGQAEVDEAAAHDLKRVAARMETLVHNLARLREHAHLTTTKVDIDALIQQTLEDMQFGRFSIKLQLDLGAGSHVLGDEPMLRRVVENLVTNAVEAMDDEGTLRIETRREGVQDNGSQVKISVADTGEGISEDFIRNNLFRPFATTKRGGLGLGLYQCRAIVRAHGGQLEVDSQLDVGTTVHMTLAADGSGLPTVPEPTTPNVSGAS
jgi:putative PEP-CTERM system histidine kinase